MSTSHAPASALAYRPETRLVHSGTLRSEFGETSEAMFLTQGYVYDSAEQCEARFKGEDPGYIYSRYSNPTISMFERRMIELEGAEAGRSTATGMAAVTTAMLAPLRAGDHVVASKALFGSCRYVVEDLLPRYGIESTLVDGLDLDQWKRAMPSSTSFPVSVGSRSRSTALVPTCQITRSGFMSSTALCRRFIISGASSPPLPRLTTVISALGYCRFNCVKSRLG